MSARVLLVDDIDANRRLLAAKLTHEYYQVTMAASGAEALEMAAADPPDIILLDVMMPGLDGYEVCRRLKDDPATRHVPIVMVSALDARIDRIKGLELGADEFLSKPVDPVQLFARMRSLARLKVVIDELRSREASGRRLGVIEGEAARDSGLDARILIIDDAPRQADRMARTLRDDHCVLKMGEPGEQSGRRPDLVIVSIAAKTFDGLAVIGQLRSAEATRHLPILAVADGDDPAKAMRALDLGANDVIYRPIDPDELSARIRTMTRRLRYMEALRAALDHSLELAVTDQLTGLFNRRYLSAQLNGLVMRASRGGDPVSVILMDLDHFKQINDTHGHDVGDLVLREFARRINLNFRPVDVACRYGGEEFVVAMPATRGDYACLVAERLRRHVASEPFPIGDGQELAVTVSLGVAMAGPGDTVDKVLKRADSALYEAKSAGRNRVMSAAA